MPGRSSASIANLVRVALLVQALAIGGTAYPAEAQASSIRLDLDRYVGKCPYQTDILRLPAVERRFRSVMGRDAWKVGVGLGVQSPMALEWTYSGKFLVLEGNKAHDSGALRILIVIDLTGGRVDVATREDGCKVHLYEDRRRSEASDVPFDNNGYPVSLEVVRWRDFVGEADSCI